MALEDEKWSLVQLLLSSSYSGYGISRLKQVLGYIFFLFYTLFNVQIPVLALIFATEFSEILIKILKYQYN